MSGDARYEINVIVGPCSEEEVEALMATILEAATPLHAGAVGSRLFRDGEDDALDACRRELAEERARADLTEEALTYARYIGDNHHNAAACPYCGDLLGKERARAARLAEALDAIAGDEPEKTLDGAVWIARKALAEFRAGRESA